jgi:hypothetical protein
MKRAVPDIRSDRLHRRCIRQDVADPDARWISAFVAV